MLVYFCYLDAIIYYEYISVQNRKPNKMIFLGISTENLSTDSNSSVGQTAIALSYKAISVKQYFLKNKNN